MKWSLNWIRNYLSLEHLDSQLERAFTLLQLKLLRMMLYTKQMLCALAYCFACIFSMAQSHVAWTDVDANSFAQRGQKMIEPQAHRLVEVDFETLKSVLQSAPTERTPLASTQPLQVEIPMPNGENWIFDMVYSPIYEAGFATQFTEVKTFAGTVADQPGVYGRFDYTPQGFHGMIMIAGETTVFIDPYTFGGGDVSHYMSYQRSELINNNAPLACGVEASHQSPSDFIAPSTRTPFASCVRREYRIAISASGEYTAFHGGTVPLAAAAQVTTMNRVNGVYERDLGIRMIIIANNADIIYTDGSSDPFTDGSAGAMINENQNNTNSVIGSANYDIGHIFSIGGSGLAGLGVVCNNNQKARGVTGIAQPVGDPYDIDYVSHEIGHQFGGNHTQNNSCNRVSDAAHEPGSASTIMGYAGICSPNVQNNSDDHFHGYNLQEMGNFISGNGGTCAVEVDLGNTHPVIASVTTGLTIPGGTPFGMTVVATDAESDPMTYCWEQIDPAVATMPPVSTATGGPAFRSNSPIASPTRNFPNLADQLAGVSPVWEVLSDVDRTYNFRVTIRDNAPGGSCSEYTDAQISVDGDSGPFVTTNPTAAGVVWSGGATQTVTWAVAGTDVAPVSCANVNIMLSTDGGLTFPITLASNVPNDGSADIIAPNQTTTTARVRVECSDNIFYDISDNDFEIGIQLEAPCQGGFAGIYPCNKYDLVSQTDITNLGGAANTEANDIWGWTDALDGKEYAILGLTTGTAFVDISDPTNPIHLGNLATNTTSSLWRDIKVYSDHAFIVSEAGGHGMQVFDLTKLRNVPSPPATFAADAIYTNFGSAHNIVINEQSGFAYAVGAGTFSGGLDFIDITNPTAPVAAGGFDGDGYTHDAQVIIYDGPDTDYTGKEIAFAANEDTFTIVDVDDKTDPQQVSRTGYAGSSYTHQGWLTDDRQYFLINDELDESNNGTNTRTFIWDIADLDAPVLIGFHEHATAAIDHNLYIDGDKVYQANYRAGLRVLDISDLAGGNMTEIGYFDVYPANDAAQFNGAWSSYPYFASGNIIISSIEEGLFIVAPSPPVICSEPITLSSSNITDSGADISWNETGSASAWDIEIVETGTAPTGTPTVDNHGSTTYTFSGGTASTSYDFYVRADCGGLAGDGESFWVGPFAFVTSFEAPQGVTCASGNPSFLLNAEFDQQGSWSGDISTVVTDYGNWIVGHSGGTFSDDTGPTGAHSGSNYIYYEASSDVTNTASLVSPLVDLSSAEVASGAELSFFLHSYGISIGTLEVGVGTSSSGPFTTEFTFAGQFQTANADAWVPIGIDLTSYIGQQIYIEFSHTGAGDYRGDLSVDQVRVEACGTFCLAPSTISAAASGAGVDIAWTENGSSTMWDLEIIPAGNTPAGVPTNAGISDNPYTWTEGMYDTSYDVYVRSVCSASESSAWIGPLSFTTPQDFCSGDQFTDDGGDTADYSTGTTTQTIICPDGAGHVEVNFLSFDVEDRTTTVCWDELYVFDGPTNLDTPITPSSIGVGGNTTGGFCWDPVNAQGTGDLSGQTLISTHESGCLTFEFVSDASVPEAGWVADVVCVDNCPWDLNPNGVIDINDFLEFNSAFGTTCSGCPADFNDDGAVNINDFLSFNSSYGQNCADLFSPNGELLMRRTGLNQELMAAIENQGLLVHPEVEAMIQKLKSENGMLLFPNPNIGDELNIRLIDGSLSASSVITVSDLVGKIHFKGNPSSAGSVRFDTALSAGMYIVEVLEAGELNSARFVVE